MGSSTHQICLGLHRVQPNPRSPSFLGKQGQLVPKLVAHLRPIPNKLIQQQTDPDPRVQKVPDCALTRYLSVAQSLSPQLAISAFEPYHLTALPPPRVFSHSPFVGEGGSLHPRLGALIGA